LCLQRAALHRFRLDAQFVEQAGQICGLQNYADRTRQRAVVSENVVAADRRHVGGRGRELSHDRDHRLLLADLPQPPVQDLAADDGTARRVDAHDQCLGGAVLGYIRERLIALRIVRDQTVDVDAGDVRPLDQSSEAPERRHDGDYSTDHRDDSPPRQPSLQPAPVDQPVSVDGHRR
jgi:hypothetical protein